MKGYVGKVTLPINFWEYEFDYAFWFFPLINNV